MDIFNIISPPNEAELSRLLRSNPLTGAVLELTVIRQVDELTARRNNNPEPQALEFQVETIYTTRPTTILGSVAMDDIAKPGRIDAMDSSENEEQNHLTLTIVD